MSEHNSLEQSIRVITLYDKLNLSRDRIRSGVSVIFTMDNSSYNNNNSPHFLKFVFSFKLVILLRIVRHAWLIVENDTIAHGAMIFENVLMAMIVHGNNGFELNVIVLHQKIYVHVRLMMV